MELDEFVDMEWLNSHSSTIKDEPFDDSCDPFYYMDSTFEPDFMAQDITDDSALNALDIQSTEEIEMPSLTPSAEPASTDLVTPSEGKEESVKPALPTTFPSTEQIKLLIEAAKKQLALQQQQQQQGIIPPSENQIDTTMDNNIVETVPITTVSPDKLTIKQEEDEEEEKAPVFSETRSQMTTARRNSKMDYDSDEEIHSPEDIKKMTPKERRQLRNKISARNFRVRRKGKLCEAKRIKQLAAI